MTEVAVAPVSIELPRDQGAHADGAIDIWYVMSSVRSGEREFGVQVLASALAERFITVWISVTERGTDTYRHDRQRFDVSTIELADDSLGLRTPTVTFVGPLEEMSLRATLGGVEVDLVLRPSSPIIYNCGTGFFPHFGGTTYQYSLPAVEMSGVVVLDGERITVSGGGWYDRQWTTSSDTFAGTNQFTWMGLCLDSGDNLSVWDTAVGDQPGRTWATVVAPDGTHVIAAVAPLDADASDLVSSESADKRYPSRWKVRIPGVDAELHVTQHRQHDEARFYTGICDVRGSYRGTPVTGYGFVDMVRA